MFDIFFNHLGILIIVCSVAAAVTYLGFESSTDRVVMIRDLGIPMGLTFSLVGMIQQVNGFFLENSGDAIYASSAVMLLTTLYGALLANVFFLPVADKLSFRSEQEAFLRRLMVDGIVAIGRGETNRHHLQAMLGANLAPKEREQLE